MGLRLAAHVCVCVCARSGIVPGSDVITGNANKIVYCRRSAVIVRMKTKPRREVYGGCH